MVEKFFRTGEEEVRVPEFFENGKGTKECKTLVFERNRCVDR